MLGGVGEGRIFLKGSQMNSRIFLLSIVLFLAGAEAQTLSRDTVCAYRQGSPDPDSTRLVITNDADSMLSLDKVILEASKRDTFPSGSVATKFEMEGRYLFLRKGFSNDTVKTFAGNEAVRLAHGESVLLDRFGIDFCYCLVKEGRRIQMGDWVTLKLRLVFSTGKAGAAPREKILYVRGRYEESSGVREQAAMRPQLRAGWSLEGYMLDGRMRLNHAAVAL
jgi:hypothetical protein